jgi:hypothetical protein
MTAAAAAAPPSRFKTLNLQKYLDSENTSEPEGRGGRAAAAA